MDVMGDIFVRSRHYLNIIAEGFDQLLWFIDQPASIPAIIIAAASPYPLESSLKGGGVPVKLPAESLVSECSTEE
jgi:hypothetical protein